MHLVHEFLRNFRKLIFGAALLAIALEHQAAYADESTNMESMLEDVVEPLEQRKRPRMKDWVAMPIPILNPTLDAGLALAVMKLYKQDPDSSASSFGGGAFGTSNGSLGGGLFTKNYIKQDSIRVTSSLGYMDLNLNFYGIGNNDQENLGLVDQLSINQTGYFAFAQSLFQTLPNLYVGMRFRYLSIQSRLRLKEDLTPDEADVQLLTLDIDSIGPGLKLEWDTRDDAWSPRSGHYLEAFMDSSMEALGSQRSYEKYNLRWSTYWGVGEDDVFAINATACGASGSAPFYDICLIGQGKNLRGYEGGRYRDDRLLTLQAEYRKSLPKRFGVALFGGVGQVGKSFEDFNRENIRHSLGVGLRWTASVDHGVRLSIDYAWGDDGHATYFYIGESF